MMIREEQLDPGMRQSLAAKIQALYRKPNKSAQEIDAVSAQPTARPVRPPIRTMLIGMAAGMFGGALTLLIPALTYLLGGIGAVLGTTVVIAYFAGFTVWLARHSRSNRPAPGLHIEGFSRLTGALDLTPVERAYCDAISALAAEDCPLDESTAKQTLDRINALVRQMQRVQGSIEHFERIGGEEALATLESERRAIVELLDGYSDSGAREDLERSLSLCDSRIESARASGPAMERLRAQKTLLENTLLSTADSLSRLRGATGLESAEIEHVTASLAQAAVNIESTEKALHEVASISG